MMINNNSAVHFYGKRPPLYYRLQGQSEATPIHMAGPLKAAGQLYMPGSQGTAAIGSIMDKFVSMGMSVVKTAFPTVGTVLSFVGDIVDFILTPMGNLMEAMATSACTYLELNQAQAVLDDMEANRTDYITDAFKDCLYAFYRRVGSTGKSALDIKEGRSSVIQGVMGGALDALGVGRNADRVANRVYKKAMGAGAKDWQAAAAVCGGLVVGLQTKGFPSGFTINVAGVEIAKVGSSTDTSKAMWALGNDFDKEYFNKLGTPVEHTAAWVEKQYKIRSGGEIGGVKKSDGGAATPLLVIAALALLANR